MSRYREIKMATAEVVGVRVVRRTSTTKAHAAIRDVIVANPCMSYQQIANLLGCSRWLITAWQWNLVSGDQGVRVARLAGRRSSEAQEVFRLGAGVRKYLE